MIAAFIANHQAVLVIVGVLATMLATEIVRELLGGNELPRNS